MFPEAAALGGDRLQARADGVPGSVHLLAAAGPEGVRAAGPVPRGRRGTAHR
ncbi:hypothetical protein ACWEPM_38040 [Streptomyces sp. NPDC004244]